MINIARNKNPSKPVKTLTKAWDSMDKYRLLYAAARRSEYAVESAKRNKPLKDSEFYKKKYLENYNHYYKNGGQQKRMVYDYTFKNMTGQDPLKPDRSKRKPSGKKIKRK